MIHELTATTPPREETQDPAWERFSLHRTSGIFLTRLGSIADAGSAIFCDAPTRPCFEASQTQDQEAQNHSREHSNRVTNATITKNTQ